MTYTIHCQKCGIIHNNKDEFLCDHCGEYFDKIKFGDTWYDVDELEEDSPFIWDREC